MLAINWSAIDRTEQNYDSAEPTHLLLEIIGDILAIIVVFLTYRPNI